MSGINQLFGSNNSLSEKTRTVILIIGVILLIANLWLIDYDQVLKRENFGTGLGILSNLLIIVAMVISKKHTAKKGEKE